MLALRLLWKKWARHIIPEWVFAGFIILIYSAAFFLPIVSLCATWELILRQLKTPWLTLCLACAESGRFSVQFHSKLFKKVNQTRSCLRHKVRFEEKNAMHHNISAWAQTTKVIWFGIHSWFQKSEQVLLSNLPFKRQHIHELHKYACKLGKVKAIFWSRRREVKK